MYLSDTISIRNGVDNLQPDPVYMGLISFPESSYAKEFCNQICNVLWEIRNMKTNPGKPFKNSVGSIVPDLILAGAVDNNRYCYRKFDSNSFVDLPVGYVSFKAAIDALKVLGFIEFEPGSGQIDGHATRLRGTAAFFDMAALHCIVPADHGRHFKRARRPETLAQPLQLRKSSTSKAGKKSKGDLVSIDYMKPDVAALAAQVHDINRFMAGQDIQPDRHWAFRRGFNQAELPDFAWNKGGRLYSIGNSYQHMEGKDRKAIRINGEAVVELDIRASHLTIVRQCLGIPFDPAVDPYLNLDVPRHVAKAWVVMTLGHDRLHRAWSDEAKKIYIKEEKKKGRNGGDISLTKEHRLKDVQAKMLTHFPFLADWQKCPIRWGDLQYLESKAVVNAVHELAMVHGIPALPVHDSLIVPAIHRQISGTILEITFVNSVGVRPYLATK